MSELLPRPSRAMICLNCLQPCLKGEPHTCPPRPARPIPRAGTQTLQRPSQRPEPEKGRADP